MTRGGRRAYGMVGGRFGPGGYGRAAGSDGTTARGVPGVTGAGRPGDGRRSVPVPVPASAESGRGTVGGAVGRVDGGPGPRDSADAGSADGDLEGTAREGAAAPPGAAAAADLGKRGRANWAPWGELLRVSALFTVPGDAFAGAAAAGRAPNRGTMLAAGASLCLYEAGMALNDWADRDVDAVERPHRPVPSGRIAPGAALAAAGGFTAAGLVLASAAGRPALTAATGIAGTVWAYDLHLKNTAAGPAAMAAARSFDLLLGASATASAARRTGTVGHGAAGSRTRRPGHVHPPRRSALPAAGLLGAHTLTVTSVSRHEAYGGSSAVPLGALAATAAIAWSAARGALREGTADVGRRGGAIGAGRRGLTTARPEAAAAGARSPVPPARYGVGRRFTGLGGVRSTVAEASAAGKPLRGAAGSRSVGTVVGQARLREGRHAVTVTSVATAGIAAAYAATAARSFARAALNPSPQLTQRAVGGGIRAMIPLQAALAARSGSLRTAMPLLALLPLARRLSRKVSPT